MTTLIKAVSLCQDLFSQLEQTAIIDPEEECRWYCSECGALPSTGHDADCVVEKFRQRLSDILEDATEAIKDSVMVREITREQGDDT